VRTIAAQFFRALAQALSPETCQQLDARLMNTPSPRSMSTLKADAGPRSLDSLVTAVDTLRHRQGRQLPWALWAPRSARYLRRRHLRVMGESLTHLRRHPDSRRYALVTLFCDGRMRDLTDRLIERLLQNVHQMSVKAEQRVAQALLADVKRVTGKTRLRFQRAAVSLAHPAAPVQEVIYPVVGVQTWRDLVTEGAATGHFYRDQVPKVMRGSDGHQYRRLVPPLLDALTFRSNTDLHPPVIEALALLQQWAGSKRRLYEPEDGGPLEGSVPPDWRPTVVGQDAQGHTRIHRITEAMHGRHAVRERLRCQELWVEGAYR
jgi:hypothetical protein